MAGGVFVMGSLSIVGHMRAVSYLLVSVTGKGSVCCLTTKKEYELGIELKEWGRRGVS